MIKLNPALKAFIGEHGSGLAGCFKLGVLIVNNCKGTDHIGQEAIIDRDAAANIDAGMLKVDEWIFFLFLVLFTLFLVMVFLFFAMTMLAMSGKAIFGGLLTHSDPQKGVIPHPAETRGQSLCFQEGIFQRVANFLFFLVLFLILVMLFFFSLFEGAKQRGFSEIRNVEIIEVALRCGQGEDERSGHDLAAPGKLGAFIDAIIRGKQVPGRGFFWEVFYNQAVNHVDHAANGLSAIGERRRAAQDFDGLRINPVG